MFRDLQQQHVWPLTTYHKILADFISSTNGCKFNVNKISTNFIKLPLTSSVPAMGIQVNVKCTRFSSTRPAVMGNFSHDTDWFNKTYKRRKWRPKDPQEETGQKRSQKARNRKKPTKEKKRKQREERWTLTQEL